MNRVRVHVTPAASKESIALKGNVLHITVRELAQHGAATRRVLVLVARHYGVNPQHVKLLTGARSKMKTFVITA
ncbi:MAG: hypothetical protein RI911_68 [Candidatus Parcubacteria bacterium]|jgi:uncharacterized protein YggU (UPF0235/DUF167 family)